MNLPSLLPAACLVVAGHAVADSPVIRTTISPVDSSHWQIAWNGAAGYTFFPQHSPDRDLMAFTFLPIPAYITGAGSLSFVIESDPLLFPKGFYRLKYTDLDPANLAGDGVPALFKINTLGMDPFVAGGKGTNGLNDAWEAYFFGAGNIDQVNPAAVLQPDGLTNKEKSDLGLDPNADYSAGGTDAAGYQYDAAGRLTEVNGTTAGAAFTPDAEGNATQAE